jgi:hypothetical protein
MMKLVVVAAAAGALMLSACNRSEAPAADASEAATPDAAAPVPAAADAAPAAAGGVPDKAFMVGKWGDAGDCQMAIDFKADGSMEGPVDKWELDDKGVLTMVGMPQKMHLKVIDQDTMESRLDGTGEPRKINRCK